MIKTSPEQEKLLLTIANFIHENQNLKESLQKIAEAAREFLGVNRVKIYQFAKDASGEVIAESVVPNTLPSLLGLHFPATDIPSHVREEFTRAHRGVVIDVSAKRKTVNIPDAANNPQLAANHNYSYSPLDPCHVQYLLAMGVLSSLSMPIFYWDKLWGLLVAHHSEPRRYSENELWLIELLSKQISLALAQDTLLSQFQQQKRQEEFIQQINNILDTSTNPNQYWSLVLEETSKTLGAEGGRLYLTSALTGEPEQIYTIGEQPELPHLEDHPQWQILMRGKGPDSLEERTNGGNSSASRAFSYTLAELDADPHLHLLSQAFKDKSIQSFLFIPLRSRNQWIGCLTLFRQEREWETLWAGRDNPDLRNRMPRQSFQAWCEIQRGVPDWSSDQIKQAQALGLHLYMVVTQQRLTHLIHHQASYDPITQLPNWLVFHQRLSLALVDAVHQGNMLGVIVADVNQFKRINDSFGHGVGDHLLQKLTERFHTYLDSISPNNLVLARWHGAGFIFLLPQLFYTDDAVVFCQGLLKCFNEPFYIQSQAIYLGVSLGIALAPYDGDTADLLIKNAETAMYQAKQQGKNTYQIYRPESNFRNLDKLVLETDLRKAIERNELVLYYQPQIELTTGKLIGVEALIRWQHPSFGMISPSEFIPLAEETSLINSIGDWVLETACSQQYTWNLSGFSHIRMAVNLSAIQLQQYDIVARIAQIVEQSQIDPAYLELEITETTVMKDIEQMTGILKQLKQMGIRLAIDDFGTGYSSLSTLKHLPVDTLKIDKSFVQDLMVDPSNAKICEGIIMLGKAFDLEVLAEGLETSEQMNLLSSLNCDRAQGYLISRPLPPEKVIEMFVKPNLLPVSPKNPSLLQKPTQIKPAIDITELQREGIRAESLSPDTLSTDKQLVQNVQEYAHLREEMRQQSTRERIIMEVAQKIRQTLSLDDILKTTVTEVRHLLNTDRVFLYAFDENWMGQVVVESVSAPQYSVLGEWIDEPCFREKYVKYYRQGRVSAIEDVAQAGLAPCHKELLLKYQVKSNLVLPVVYQDKLWGLLIAHECRQIRRWQQHEITLLTQIAIQAAIAIHQGEIYKQLEAANLELKKLSSLDGLTQVANRGHFDNYFEQEWRRLMRSRDCLSLILCDVDHFKWYNDTYGHSEGDLCLQKVAETMKQVVRRPADLVARYGGEEFVILLPQTPLDGAIHVAQLLSQKVRDLKIPHAKSAHQYVTLSIGVASLIPSVALSPKVLIEAAAQCLYQAKALGRNQVVSRN